MSIYDTPPEIPSGRFADRPHLPYMIPFLAFVAIMLPASFGTIGGIDFTQLLFNYLPADYTVKTVVAAVLLWALWDYFTPIKWTHLPLGIAVGIVGTFLWVLTEYACQNLWQHWTGNANYPRLFGAVTKFYVPPLMIHTRWKLILFYIIRIGGPTLVVPVMEELFFRDLVMRALIRGLRFQSVPIGTFTWASLFGMALLFGANHYQWPSGIIYGLMMGILLIRTKSLGACIVAHGTTNLTLYLWVVWAASHWSASHTGIITPQNPGPWQFL